MRVPSNGIYIDDPAYSLVKAIISYWGITSGAGNAGGTTLVCSDLATQPSYDGLVVKILSGGAAGQARTIQVHATTTLTVGVAFTDSTGAAQQIGAGTRFVILSSLTGGGGPGPAPAEGLSYYGVVDSAAAPSFTISGLAGLGTNKFASPTNPYQAFVLRDSVGGVAPQGEMQPITAYTTATGAFTTPVFTVAVAAGDEVLIVNPTLAAALTMLTKALIQFDLKLDSTSRVDQDGSTVASIAITNQNSAAGLVTAAQITTAPTITYYRTRQGYDTTYQLIGAFAMTAADGWCYHNYEFPSASWQKGDGVHVVVTGCIVTIAGVTYLMPSISGAFELGVEGNSLPNMDTQTIDNFESYVNNAALTAVWADTTTFSTITLETAAPLQGTRSMKVVVAGGGAGEAYRALPQYRFGVPYPRGNGRMFSFIAKALAGTPTIGVTVREAANRANNYVTYNVALTTTSTIYRVDVSKTADATGAAFDSNLCDEIAFTSLDASGTFWFEDFKFAFQESVREFLGTRLTTGYDSTAVTANEDGSVMERLEDLANGGKGTDAIFDKVNAILTLAETGGTLTATGGEDNVYVVNVPAGLFKPQVVLIDLDAMTTAAGDISVIKVYYKLKSGGGFQLYDYMNFTGDDGGLSDNKKIIAITLLPNRFGVKVTLTQTAGVNKTYDWEVLYES